MSECLSEYLPNTNQKRNHLADVGMIMMQTGMVNQGITSVMNTMEGTLSNPFPQTNPQTNYLRFAALYPVLISVYIYTTKPKELFVAANPEPNQIDIKDKRSDNQSTNYCKYK